MKPGATPPLPPPPDLPLTSRERMWAAVERAANAIADQVEDGRLQPLSPTYMTRAQVQDALDGLIRDYNEEKHNTAPEDGEPGQALDRLVSMDGAIDALQTLRYKLFGSPLDLRGDGEGDDIHAVG